VRPIGLVGRAERASSMPARLRAPLLSISWSSQRASFERSRSAVFAAAMVALAATLPLAWAYRPPPVGGRRWRWT
jgi:hypothetical protein